jgi:hypothetical protein
VSRDADGYTLEEVEKLLGIGEPTGRAAARYITIADILSWARDPGPAGGDTWALLAQRPLSVDAWAELAEQEREEDRADWTARRGPLGPTSDLALTLWDFLRVLAAMRRTELIAAAAIALKAMGFDFAEIGAALDWDGKPELNGRELKSRQQRAIRMVRGTEVRDREGRVVRDAKGAPMRRGGAADRLHMGMNGHLPKSRGS